MEVERKLQSSDSNNGNGQVVVKRDYIFEQNLPEKLGDPLKFDWLYKKFIGTMEVTYLIPTEELKFKVVIPNDTYVSLGFGKNMNKVDMIGWHALGEDSKAVDYWSVAKLTPDIDGQ